MEIRFIDLLTVFEIIVCVGLCGTVVPRGL